MSPLVTHFLQIFALNVLRYLIFAGSAFLLFYVWKKRKFSILKIQSQYPDKADMLREILYSLCSLFIFACIGSYIFWLSLHGQTLIYRDWHSHSLGYFIFSVGVFIIAHDTYFYWTHRLMHWHRLYPYIHRIHHLSTNPTPWAAFAFHPLEAIVEIGILVIMVFAIPLHPLAILVWILYMTALNVLGHLGFELFPRGFTSGTITRWHNTSLHHNMHHRFVRCNYGLYFNIWDRILGTNHAKYTDEYESLKKRTYTNIT